MAQNENTENSGMGISFSGRKPVTDNPLLLKPDADIQPEPVIKPKQTYPNVLIPKNTGRESYLDKLTDTKAEQEEHTEKQNKKLSDGDRKTIRILAILNVAVFVVIGAYLLFSGGAGEYDIGDEEEDIIPYHASEVFSGELEANINGVEFPDDIQFYFKRLYSENQDAAGWITIDGTSIDFPVLRAADNEKYERANFYGEYDRRGSIFMDYRNTIGKGSSSLSKVTIIWGHHLTEDATIFADLDNYMDVEYYKEHPVIEMNTLYDDCKWKIFACFTAAVEEEDEGGEVFYYWNPYIKNEQTQGFVNECLNRSWFINPDVDIRDTDKLLCLSTCTYILNKYSYHEIRTVIMARLVRPGENEDVEVANAYLNENRRMPQLYYDINNISNPFAGVPCWTAT